MLTARSFFSLLGFSLLAACSALAGEAKVYSGPACAPVDEYFVNEVWAKVGAQVCIECHKTGGDAEDSKFILLDPKKTGGVGLEQLLRQNRNAFVLAAHMKEGDQSRML